MKKFISALMALVMTFSLMSVAASASLFDDYRLSDSYVTVDRAESTTIYMEDFDGNRYKAIWTTEDPDIVRVNNGTITGLKVGTAKVVGKIGDEKHTCTVTVRRPDYKLSTTDLTMYITDSNKAIKIYNSKTGREFTTPNWTSDDTSVVTVNNGRVSPKGAGYARVTATIDGEKLSCYVTVKNRKFKLSETSKSLNKGETLKLHVFDENGNRYLANWQSSDPSVATVSRDGIVTAKSGGSTTITATTYGKEMKCRIYVYNW